MHDLTFFRSVHASVSSKSYWLKKIYLKLSTSTGYVVSFCCNISCAINKMCTEIVAGLCHEKCMSVNLTT